MRREERELTDGEALNYFLPSQFLISSKCSKSSTGLSKIVDESVKSSCVNQISSLTPSYKLLEDANCPYCFSPEITNGFVKRNESLKYW